MTASEISDLEEKLGLAFPPGVNAFLKNIGQLPSRVSKEGDVLRDANAVLELNASLRTEGFYQHKWPAEFFAIGSDPGGCIYFFDLRTAQAPVFFADYDYHDISDFQKLADTPEDFVAYVRQMDSDREEQERRISPAPTAKNILAAVKGDSRGRVHMITLLSSPTELERWWLDEVGWNADEPSMEAAINKRLEFLVKRAKENGWETRK
jgi:hypothetical protein